MGMGEVGVARGGGERALRAESSLTESFAPTAATGLSYPLPQELSDYNRPRSLQLANRF